ncbi:alpha/beta hydrolase [Pseudoxanthomonas sp. LjRoot143]|uniref:serine aminopeptidase domain-containing protein n=1 Tax=Pseudoxanthomonas sp. LjRoot143 TaxID=3342266 RepID=UPI003ECE4B4D
MAGRLPLHFGSPARRLFGVFHPAQDPPQGALLVCPPFFHEHARSYRLFALLADALSERGIATLRFDYYGTGDSAGDDDDFTPEGACKDATEALASLRSRVPHAPLFVMGVRGGALPALRLVQEHPPAALWLWQPVTDWPGHLDELQRLHASRRALVPGAGDEAAEATLMGFRYGEGVPARLAALGSTSLPPACSLVLSESAPFDGLPANRTHLPLPPALANWVSRPDMDAFPGRQVRDLAARFPIASRTV